MRVFIRTRFIAISTVLAALVLHSPAKATTIFTENFNAYSTGYTGTQADTGLTVGAYGTLSGWTAAGTNAIHAEERSAGDWAIMLYDTNSITLNSGIAANQLGVTYTVSFQAAAATWNDDSQATLSPQDFLHFDILNLSNSVLASSNFATPSWSFGPTNAFVNGSFTYVGTGTGNVLIRISDTLVDNRFAGAIDNLSVSTVPEPGSLFLLSAGLFGLGFIRSRVKG
jgi:hypothetical protein